MTAGPTAGGEMRLAILSMHTDPLSPLGGDLTGGMNVYVREIAKALSGLGVQADVFTRLESGASDTHTPLAPGCRLVRIPAGPARKLDKDAQHAWVEAFGAPGFWRSPRRTRRTTTEFPPITGCRPRRRDSRPDVGRSPRLALSHPRRAQERRARLRKQARVGGPPGGRGRTRTIGRRTPRLLPRRGTRGGGSLGRRRRPRRPLRGGRREIPAPFQGCGARALRDRTGRGLRSRRGPHRARQGPRPPDRSPRHADARTPRPQRTPASRGRCAQREHRKARNDPPPRRGLRLARPEAEVARLTRLAHRRRVDARVRFLGARPQETLPLFYSAADLLALPSHYESFGIVALEAAACGLPTLAFDVGGVSRAVGAGESGYLVPEGDTAAYAREMARILQGARTFPRAAAWARSFTWTQWPRRNAKIWQRLRQPAEATLASHHAS